jgi:hypothetical protein
VFIVFYSNGCLIGNSKYLEDIEKLKEKYPQLTYFEVEIGMENYVFSIPISDEELLKIAKSNSILIM